MDRMNKGCVAEEKRNSWRGLGARCLLWCWSGEIAGSLEGFPMNNCMINKRETMTYEVTSRGNKSSLIFSVKKTWWRKIHGNSLPSPKKEHLIGSQNHLFWTSATSWRHTMTYDVNIHQWPSTFTCQLTAIVWLIKNHAMKLYTYIFYIYISKNESKDKRFVSNKCCLVACYSLFSYCFQTGFPLLVAIGLPNVGQVFGE